MNAAETDALGERIVARLEEGRPAEAYDLLAPVLARRTRFRLLDRIGRAAAAGPPDQVDAWLEALLVGRGRRPGAILLRKARTYL